MNMKKEMEQSGESAKIQMTESFGIRINNGSPIPYSQVMTSLVQYHPRNMEPPGFM